MVDAALMTEGLLSLQAGKKAPAISKNVSVEKARQTAVDFEAFFLGQMLQPMFANISPEPPFGGGHAEKIWRSMMVDEMGKSMAEAGGIGIADSIHRAILKLQEVQ